MPDEFDRFLQDVSDGVKRVVVAIGPGENDDSKFHVVPAPCGIAGASILAHERPSHSTSPVLHLGRFSTRERTRINRKAETKTTVIFNQQFMTLVDAHRGRLKNLRASTLQLRVQGIEVVDPDVSIDADAASSNIR